ncbi:MAG: iron-sulfur cluster carrier protein ApbC [Gammaproteobacteria bacterium]
MFGSLEKRVAKAVAALPLESLATTVAGAGVAVEVKTDGKSVRVLLRPGFPCDGLRDALAQAVAQAAVGAGAEQVQVAIEPAIQPHQAQQGFASLDAVKNVIVVASGKGGVGKSTTSVNLALALAAEGARVGILDADVTGPSQQMMLGVPVGRRPEVKEEKYFVPVVAHGVQSMSMGYMADQVTAIVWRGPKLAGALQQLALQTLWNDLDYLVIDMPPGTGDVQLTLAQRIPVAAAVIVTTPQDIALMDARRGIEMFRKVDIPVLGVIENMAMHVCSNCGHVEHIFGEGGGARMAQEYGTELLGSLPLDRRIREQADGGRPTVVAEPDGPLAQAYRQIARKLTVRLALRPLAKKQAFPKIVQSTGGDEPAGGVQRYTPP